MQRFAAIVALLALALPLHAQQDNRFGERLDVNVVLIDAIVTDGKGNQILGLDKSDFVVKEDGAEQPLDSIDYFTNRRLLTAREENAPFKAEQVREERYFIFFFDKPTDTFMHDQLVLAREAAKHFVNDEMKPTDRVAVAGHDVRLKLYSDFTSDKAALNRALDDVTEFGLGIKEKPASTEESSILRNLDVKKMINRTGTVYQALDVLADSVRAIRARKNVILFSPGIIEHGEDVYGGILANRSRYLDPALHSLNAANVTVDAVNLWKDPPSDPAYHERLEEITRSTGGTYFRQNTSFSPAVQKIENTNNGYYLLTYRTKHAAGTSGFQRVDVSVRNHPEFTVKARSGYAYGG